MNNHHALLAQLQARFGNQPDAADIRKRAWPLKEPQCAVCHRLEAGSPDILEWGRGPNAELLCPQHLPKETRCDAS